MEQVENKSKSSSENNNKCKHGEHKYIPLGRRRVSEDGEYLGEFDVFYCEKCLDYQHR